MFRKASSDGYERLEPTAMGILADMVMKLDYRQPLQVKSHGNCSREICKVQLSELDMKSLEHLRRMGSVTDGYKGPVAS
jgi:hypothetical protein